MTLRESPARTGFEVAFETDGASLIRELNDDVTFPWSTRNRVGTPARIVVRQSGVHITREANIEMRVVIRVSENVDESLGARHGSVDGKRDAYTMNVEMCGNPEARFGRVAVPAGD
jgi:hypothetical protein